MKSSKIFSRKNMEIILGLGTVSVWVLVMFLIGAM